MSTPVQKYVRVPSSVTVTVRLLVNAEYDTTTSMSLPLAHVDTLAGTAFSPDTEGAAGPCSKPSEVDGSVSNRTATPLVIPASVAPTLLEPVA